MGAVDFVPKTQKDKLTKFYVPADEWSGEYYPPDEYTGTAVKVDDSIAYAIEHINEINLDDFHPDEELMGERFFKEYRDWFFEDWIIVTYDEMCPDMDDYYDPKDTGHGYWDFY